MKLFEIIDGINFEKLSGTLDVEITNLNYDSRKVAQNELFFCIEGFNTDGHMFIKSAIEKGAAAIICRKVPDSEVMKSNCSIIQVSDTRKAMAICAANFFHNSYKKLKLIGITGTNGKTTSTFMIKNVLEEAGKKVGIIGTIANYIGTRMIETHRTTPESLELHELFSEMADEGVDYCVMEVSSHSLALDRVYGINFDEGIFTNLTQDHLDFHKTFENYFEAKLVLFKNSKNSIVNIDDLYGQQILDRIQSEKMSYSVKEKADITAEDINMHSRGIDFTLCYMGNKSRVTLGMPGRYNLYNALCCAGACLSEGIEFSQVVQGLNKMPGVPGRCELVSRKYDLDFDIIIDYAHTPDALENILNTVREFAQKRIITVFGCGGSRDKTKRPKMGYIATELSDIAIITSDNPRAEEPEDIINDIIEGTKKNNYSVVVNRRDAIKKAIDIAQERDIIIIAGKGHENYQELKDETIHFDEREIIDEILKYINR